MLDGYGSLTVGASITQIHTMGALAALSVLEGVHNARIKTGIR